MMANINYFLAYGIIIFYSCKGKKKLNMMFTV